MKLIADEKKDVFGCRSTSAAKARKLRRQQTYAEEILWNYLRTKPFGFKFRRQHPFSVYILDFYCHSLKHAIEVDDSIHELEEVKKMTRQDKDNLNRGLILLRLSNNKIKPKLEEVI